MYELIRRPETKAEKRISHTRWNRSLIFRFQRKQFPSERLYLQENTRWIILAGWRNDDLTLKIP